MKEKELRKYHRILGVIFATLFVIQATTGLILTVIENHEHQSDITHAVSLDNGDSKEKNRSIFMNAVESIHMDGGNAGLIYRLIVGIGLLAMSWSGVLIFRKIQGRKQL